MIHIVHELRSVRGGTAKKAILEKHREEDWLRALYLMYDESINFGVSAPKDCTFVDDPDYDEMFFHLGRLIRKEATGNEAKELALKMSRTYGEMARLILGRSLKANVGVTTLNKVYDNLIPVFKFMKAKKDVPITFPVWGSIKYDGVRLLAHVQGGGVTLHTSSGKVLDFLSLRLAMSKQKDGWYDGELVFGDGKQAGRTGITGAVNKILLGSSTHIKGAMFCIFDYIPLDEWQNKNSVTDYSTRLTRLHSSLLPDPLLTIVSQKVLTTQQEVDEYFQDLLTKGYEGAILRYSTDLYEWCRSPRMIKLKANKTATLRCIDTTEGTGKYEGMIGALICEGEVEGEVVNVKLGTGLSDFDRERDPNDYLCHKIEASYNDLVKNEDNAYHSLFLPVFKRVVGNV